MVNSSIHERFFCGKKRTMRGGGKISDFVGLVNEKKQFLMAVFANLIAQLGITYYVMKNYGKNDKKEKNHNTYSFPIFMIQLIIIIVLALVPMHVIFKFILFSIFSGLWGVLLADLPVDSNLIQTAIFGTMAIFGAMIILGAGLIVMGINLGAKVGFYLLLALLLLIIAQVVTMFMGTYSTVVKALSVVGLLIFSGYIIYDTNTILQRNYYGDFITASLDYYLDVLNIFLDLINLQQR